MSCSLVKARDRGKKNKKKNGKRTGEIKRIWRLKQNQYKNNIKKSNMYNMKEC